MDVYLIPVGPDRYELYCEDRGDAEAIVSDVQPTGRFAGLYQKFKAALAQVEQERQSGIARVHDRPRSWTERMKDRAMCWVAEKIAEQRLLWRLRKEPRVELFYPDDISGDEAWATTRAMLQREADRHLKWTIIDGTLFVLSGVVALVPGPNILAYYFGFRLVGHYLSRRGAKNGLQNVEWHRCPSAQISRLRHAIALVAHERVQQVHEVASELRLQHLATFFERTSIHPA
jgi:K+-H+ exchange-related protein